VDAREVVVHEVQRKRGHVVFRLLFCRVWIEARNGHKLNEAQKRTAAKAEMLSFGFAEVGIAALVDEATGYQRDRATDALARILEAFIAKDLQPYIPTFQPDFHAQLFRLRGLEYPKDTGEGIYRPHRAFAAFFAMALRLRGDSAAALAAPPFAPPSFPNATAAGFLPAFGLSSGEPSNFSPMACSTTFRATIAKFFWFA
jgi:hypothetical protein